MPRLNPAAIDTPSIQARQTLLTKSKPTAASNRLLAAITAGVILAGGIAIGCQWQSATDASTARSNQSELSALPRCNDLAPSTHQALCLVPTSSTNAALVVLSANGDRYTLNGLPTK